MVHTITIQTESDNDFALLKGLAERLGLTVNEAQGSKSVRDAEQKAALRKFIGSWRGEETAEELEAMIYNARSDRSRDVEL
ncbi:MAG: hypothetical protein BGO21_11630 [Dyadobacter sp. 50-39]|uniref:hypothetical protein n=1 Tax=Dyadobacter sp. 50-39 TaxID=1895756 RepID=UPI000964DBDB|nr:hypothetical protein [Dyadobacter sp. 50-39]OJV20033.1 MAG: hypothetical protein BGO21_11630 [Dyadobacter sp. 50-39]